MSRRILAHRPVVLASEPASAAAASPTAGVRAPDDYTTRVLKYIPAEVVVLYVSGVAAIPAHAAHRAAALWGVFGFCLAATPLYLLKLTHDAGRKPAWGQVLLSTVAFPVWAYAIGGPFATLPWYEAYLGSLLLLAVTFLFGLIVPPPQDALTPAPGPARDPDRRPRTG
jgi:uncharacterized membrane protein